ncbi:MAG: nucleoside deaminase [Oscillospiraceae bacterium]
MKLQHSDYMDIAIEQAQSALALGDVPIGCIIVKDDIIVGRGYNTRERDKNALGHAELMAIKDACTNLASWRLSGCTLYVTLEPCPMCMGAIINARLDCVVFGALDSKAGCCGSVINLNEQNFNHKVEILAGIRELKCQKMLCDFFKTLR